MKLNGYILILFSSVCVLQVHGSDAPGTIRGLVEREHGDFGVLLWNAAQKPVLNGEQRKVTACCFTYPPLPSETKGLFSWFSKPPCIPITQNEMLTTTQNAIKFIRSKMFESNTTDRVILNNNVAWYCSEGRWELCTKDVNDLLDTSPPINDFPDVTVYIIAEDNQTNSLEHMRKINTLVTGKDHFIIAIAEQKWNEMHGHLIKDKNIAFVGPVPNNYRMMALIGGGCMAAFLLLLYYKKYMYS